MRKTILRASAACLLLAAMTLPAHAREASESDEVKRVRMASEAFREIMQAPDSAIPQAILDKAEGIAVFPNVLKLALSFGGEYGKGVISVRNKETNTWSAPAFLTLAGGSWGAQIGGESADIILVVMNRRGLESLMSSEFTIGGEAAVAAGPVGRRAAASTDAAMHAQILSYSRSRGLFAGVSLSGAAIKEDIDANEDCYGARLHTREIALEGRARTAPQVVAVWRSTLDKYFMSDRAATSGKKDEAER
jgi:lipid-binding SYLF domain-containing protein